MGTLFAVPGAGNDDNGITKGTSRVVFNAVPRITYNVHVGGFNAASGRLSIQFSGDFPPPPPPPSNDTFPGTPIRPGQLLLGQHDQCHG